MEELKKLKDIVKSTMEHDAKTRSSDKWLIIEVLRAMGFRIYIDYTQLKEMPSFESITRCRRKIQEDKRTLQPTEDAGNQRNTLETKHREFFRQ